MSKGKSKTKTTAEQTATNSGTSTTSLDPRQSQALYDNIGAAQGLTAAYTPYTGAGLTAAQTAATAIPDVTAMTYAPDSQKATTVGPTAKGYEGLTNYFNPYETQVVDNATADIERARQIAGMTDAAKATAAGAFGGSRHGVADSLTNEAYDRNTNTTVAGLRQAGFTQAAQLAAQDAAQTNAAAQQQAQLDAARRAADAEAANRSYETNIGNNQAAQTANQSAQATRAGLLGNLSAQEYAQYKDAQDRPLTIQQLINQALGLVPNTGTTATSGASSGNSSGTSETKTSSIDFVKAAATAAQLAALSDVRLKRDVQTVGRDSAGRRIVTFAYLWDGPGIKHTGHIAQEIAVSDPHAVSAHPSGYLMVDYARLEAA
jgi:hypothetical protein